MFAQRGKTWDDEGNIKYKKQRPSRNLDHITCNDCGEKVHYAGNNDCPTKDKLKEDAEAFRKMKQEKSSNKPPGGGDQKALVNVKDALCSLMMGSPTDEWGELLSHGLMLCQTLTQEARQNQYINNSVRKSDSSIMHVGNTILAASEEAGIDENWCLLDNQSTRNAFINGKYLSNIRYAPDGQYLHVHCNKGATHTNKIVDLPWYSDTVWYNPNGISNILSLGLVQKNHPVTYNSRYGNGFVIQSPQRRTFKMTKAGILYQDKRHLLKNKDTHILVNDSHSPIPQVQDKKERYTARDIQRADCARWFQHITGQPIKLIPHAVDI